MGTNGQFTTNNLSPSTGIGNIGSPSGAASAPGNPAPNFGFMGGQPPAPPGGVGSFLGFGNGQPPQQPPQNTPGHPSGFDSIGSHLASMSPDTQNALRNIPPQAMEQLHQAGLIHPQLMDHINSQRGVGNNPGYMGGGRSGPMTGEQR